jgi:hypothetical protein
MSVSLEERHSGIYSGDQALDVCQGSRTAPSSSLRAANNCPRGMYLTPSPETLLRWHGVFFVQRGTYIEVLSHRWHHLYPCTGPYAGSVLRFTLQFPSSYPQNGPTVRFDSDVFHRENVSLCSQIKAESSAMVDPKTKVWHPRGRLARWQYVALRMNRGGLTRSGQGLITSLISCMISKGASSRLHWLQ